MYMHMLQMDVDSGARTWFLSLLQETIWHFLLLWPALKKNYLSEKYSKFKPLSILIACGDWKRMDNITIERGENLVG